MKSATANTTDLKLRDATAGDTALLAQLHIESWQANYAHIYEPRYLEGEMTVERRAHWAAHLPVVLAGAGHIYIAERAGEPLGFVCVLLERDAEWGGYVDNLHVRPHLKGGGIGKVMLDAALAWLNANDVTKAYLWVFAENLSARHFYEREGWRNAEELPAVGLPGAEGAVCCRYVRGTT